MVRIQLWLYVLVLFAVIAQKLRCLCFLNERFPFSFCISVSILGHCEPSQPCNTEE